MSSLLLLLAFFLPDWTRNTLLAFLCQTKALVKSKNVNLGAEIRFALQDKFRGSFSATVCTFESRTLSSLQLLLTLCLLVLTRTKSRQNEC